VRLITHRNQAPGVEPDFSDLALDIPANADDFDGQESRAPVRRTEANYYRLLWDYAAGNPGGNAALLAAFLGIAHGERPPEAVRRA
jgi:hypothetical protein